MWWAFEPKWDGFRCIALGSADRVTLLSRQQRPLDRYFPEIVSAVAALGSEMVLDGELVVWRNGTLDFAAWQRRLHPAEFRARQLADATPACYVIFDILDLAGRDQRRKPCWARRALLEPSSADTNRARWYSRRCPPTQPPAEPG